MPRIDGKLVDPLARQIRPSRVTFEDGVITSIETLLDDSTCPHFLMPGFIDSHIHIESSMLTPSQFARMAVNHGTVSIVTDPHEIANVLGVEGIHFMLNDAANVPFKFWFGAPSCVPATAFETAGAEIDVVQTELLLDDPRIHYLAEMMNFPGVLAGQPDVMAKIQAARSRDLPIDGHAPGLRGDEAARYFAAGISTDHECTTEAEAIDKLAVGAQIQIREGSAARNFEALCGLIDRYPGRILFCSDDKHPDELLIDHINGLCRRAIAAGCDVFNTLTAACLAPVQHYGLPVGLLRVGDPADFIEVGSLEQFDVVRTFIDGVCVAEGGASNIKVTPVQAINQFSCRPKSVESLAVAAESDSLIRVIIAHDGLLTTDAETAKPKVDGGQIVADVERDLLKIVVVNRYVDAAPAIGFVRGFRLQRGAIASSVAHDSHNIIAVGTNDVDLAAAVNAVIRSKGGLATADGDQIETLPLPVAGLMSTESCESVGANYQRLDQIAKEFGAALGSPFMTLSFMALLVIPSVKLSDKGLFDGSKFEFVDLQVQTDSNCRDTSCSRTAKATAARDNASDPPSLGK